MIIGIAGQKRSGKDTLAEGLSAQLQWPRCSFAAPMREFTAGLLGMTLTELEKVKEDPIDWLDGVTPRHIMQTLGTEWGRDMVHHELWVRSLFKRIAQAGGDAIISDVRFVNEAQMILDKGGMVFRIYRPGLPKADAHASEAGIPDELVTVDLVNDSTPEALVQRAMACL